MNERNQKLKKPEQVKAIKYRGKLNAAQAAAGMNAAVRNARRLLADALLLSQSGRHATAAALAVLAIEENGKCGIIQRILLAKNDHQRAEHWKEYTSHKAKNLSWIVPGLIEAGARHLDDLSVIADGSSIHPHVLDDFKHWGLYTECRSGEHWSEPEHEIRREMTSELIRIADALIRNMVEVTEERMSIYVKHFSPVWAGDYQHADSEKVREAAKAYIMECKRRGWLDSRLDVETFFRVSKPPVP